MLSSLRGFFSREGVPRFEKEKTEIPRFSGGAETRMSDLHEHNEDNHICDHEHQLYAVFDGVGGAEGGALASAAAKEVFQRELSSVPFLLDEQEAITHVRTAVQHAHLDICSITVEGVDQIPGTTATVLKFFKNPKTKKTYGVVAQVGDSRLYHESRGVFRRVTRDHNDEYQQKIIAEGIQGPANRLSVVDAKTPGFEDMLDTWEGVDYSTPDGTNVFVQSKRRNVITSSLGIRGNEPNYVDVVIVKDIFPGDRFLITSDGIHDNLTSAEIYRTLKDAAGAQDLIVAAHARSAQPREVGGNFRAKPDDMTVVVVEVNQPASQKKS